MVFFSLHDAKAIVIKDKSKNVSPYAINKLLDKVYQESTQTIENILVILYQSHKI